MFSMNESEIKIIGNCIMLPNGKSQVFLYDIEKHLVYRDMVFIVLSPPPKTIFNENVFALNAFGNIVWQIGEIEIPEGQNRNCPFVDVMIDKSSGNLLLFCWCSYRYTVIPETGEILKTEFTK
jgi:hypothetical protein